MNRTLLAAIVATALGTACNSTPPTVNQETKAIASNGVPRTADGKPDLNGVWQGGNGRRGTWEEANSGLGVGGTGTDAAAPANPASQQVITDPAPYKPEAAARVLESFNKRGIDDPAGLCLPLGVPRLALVGLFPIQIVQTPTQVVILHEYMSVFRVIPLNAEHRTDVGPAYMGDSVGHWEGDTLVVEVTNFNGKNWFDRAGNFHSDALKVTERYSPISPDAIRYEAAIEDPKTFTRSWSIAMPLYRRLEENATVLDYPCIEFAEEFMYGHLRKSQLVKHWEGETLIVDITRKIPPGDRLHEWYRR